MYINIYTYIIRTFGEFNAVCASGHEAKFYDISNSKFKENDFFSLIISNTPSRICNHYPWIRLVAFLNHVPCTGWKFSFQSTETFLNFHWMLTECSLKSGFQALSSDLSVDIQSYWMLLNGRHISVTIQDFFFREKNQKKSSDKGF